MILLTSLYETGKEDRDKEFLKCLDINSRNEYISEICVVFEGVPGVVHKQIEKYVKHYIKGRPRYDDFFKIANEDYNGEIVIVSNADIYFDDTLQHVLNCVQHNKLIMLTRHDQNGNFQTSEETTACADAWVFKSPTTMKCNCMLGVPYCDGKISSYAHSQGFEVVNYSKDVKITHVHNPLYINNKRSQRIYTEKSLYVQITKSTEQATIKPYLKDD